MQAFIWLLLVAALGWLAPAAETAATRPARRAAPDRVVYAWFPRDMSTFSTRAIDWSALTHVCFRSVLLQPDGTVKTGRSDAEIRKLVAEAHRHGVKVTVLAWGTTRDNSSEYLAKRPEKTVQSLLAFVRKHNLDGVNIDDETWRETNTVTNKPNGPLVTRFFRLLHRAFKDARPDYHISYASPPVISPKARKFAANWIDYKAIADLVDGFTIMSYCMAPRIAGWTGGTQPVAGGAVAHGHRRDYVTLVADYLDATGGRKEKLLIGMALYNESKMFSAAAEWDCKTDKPLCRQIIGKHRVLTLAEAHTRARKHGRRLDPKQKTWWYCHRRGDHFVQGWYDDAESLAMKFAWAREIGIAGVCVWVIDGANEPPETFRMIHRELLGRR